ncbi:MAG TPA: hypothetical protein VKG38_07980 [Solirubrobacteraceae bacterium]|nr:hypothetical protein [Solirubrobacteraceae bacterium]
MSDERYTAKGKSVAQLLEDYELHLMDASQKGNTVDYLHAALMARAAQVQRFWAIVAAVAACLSVGVAIVALVVAAHNG